MKGPWAALELAKWSLNVMRVLMVSGHRRNPLFMVQGRRERNEEWLGLVGGRQGKKRGEWDRWEGGLVGREERQAGGRGKGRHREKPGREQPRSRRGKGGRHFTRREGACIA